MNNRLARWIVKKSHKTLGKSVCIILPTANESNNKQNGNSIHSNFNGQQDHLHATSNLEIEKM